MLSSLQFSSLLLDEQLLDALEQLGISEMTDVQKEAIPQALAGKDLIVNAKTGSGKTLSYVLPLLQQIIDNPQSVAQALILAPTRELCRQINKQCTLLARFTDISTAVIIGGENPKYQIIALQKFPDIIIATPGRLQEHVKREVIDLDAINILVMDEADRMLDMGFSDQVIKIANQCSDECQVVLYSASFNQHKFTTLIDKVLFEPETIIVDSARENNINIDQQKILADDIAHKLKLCDFILQNDQFTKALVFANKRETVNNISSWLQSKGIKTAVVHSDIRQDVRNQLLRKFRNNDIDIIIATDVASRGLDINGLDLIINFDVPHNGEDYMHRIGRTGRMFDTGTAITLVNSQEWNQMISIENFLHMKCELRKIKSLAGEYTGPEKMKSSGKSYGVKRKKTASSKSGSPKSGSSGSGHSKSGNTRTGSTNRKDDKSSNKNSKTKNRLRDRKNIGKRRKPSAPKSAEQQPSESNTDK